MRYCNDAGPFKPGCLTVADARYTMRFEDIGEPPIYWCAACGPEAHEMNKLISNALAEDQGFAAELEAAISAVTPAPKH